MEELTPEEKTKVIELESKIRQYQIIQYGVSSAGTIAGWVFAAKTGGGFWRYVGFGLIGGIAFGSIGYVGTLSATNKVLTEIEKIKK